MEDADFVPEEYAVGLDFGEGEEYEDLDESGGESLLEVADEPETEKEGAKASESDINMKVSRTDYERASKGSGVVIDFTGGGKDAGNIKRAYDAVQKNLQTPEEVFKERLNQ